MRRSPVVDQQPVVPSSSIPADDPFTVVGPAPAPTGSGCPVDHVALAAAARAEAEAEAAAAAAAAAPSASKCPVDHVAMAAAAAQADRLRDGAEAAAAGGCPVAHGAPRVVHRSNADLFVRRVLRIKERPAGVSMASVYTSFRRSMLISATRCTLTYLVLPFLAPAIGVATGVGPVLGITIGLVAMVCDVFTIRRFHAVDHKWRWPVTIIAGTVIALLSVLMVQDISHLVS